MKRILVTGSSGFIGRHLCETLAKNQNNYVFCLDKKKLKFYNKYKNLRFLQTNLNKNTIFPKVDIVFHLAAFNGTKFFYSKSFEVLKDNIIPTFNLLNFYKKNKPKLFVYAGSPESTTGATDYFNYKLPTDEKCPFVVDDPLNLRWCYGGSKGLGEQFVISSGINFIILRYNNIYGKFQKDHFIPDFIKRVKKNKFELYGYKNTRTMLHVKDAIYATIKVTENKKCYNEIFNLGGDKEMSILSIAKMIMKKINKNNKIKLKPAPKGSAKRRFPDTKKIKKFIGFKPKISMSKGLDLLINKK